MDRSNEEGESSMFVDRERAKISEIVEMINAEICWRRWDGEGSLMQVKGLTLARRRVTSSWLMEGMGAGEGV